MTLEGSAHFFRECSCLVIVQIWRDQDHLIAAVQVSITSTLHYL